MFGEKSSILEYYAIKSAVFVPFVYFQQSFVSIFPSLSLQISITTFYLNKCNISKYVTYININIVLLLITLFYTFWKVDKIVSRIIIYNISILTFLTSNIQLIRNEIKKNEITLFTNTRRPPKVFAKAFNCLNIFSNQQAVGTINHILNPFTKQLISMHCVSLFFNYNWNINLTF